MKRLLTILILIFTFQIPSQADDIRDFQIEGMSIGDSLLDFISEDKIVKKYFPKSKKFYTVELTNVELDVYDDIELAVKDNDKTYKIHGVRGYIFFENDTNNCLKKKDEIVEELSEFFKNNARKIDKGAIDYISDIKSDTSKIVTVQFIFNSGDAVHVTCYDMQDSTLGATGVEVSTTTREYWKWNNTEAY